MTPPAVRTVRRQGYSPEAVLARVEESLGTGKRLVGSGEIAALMTPWGWEATFPQRHDSAASTHVVSTDRLLLVRYEGPRFSARFRRAPSTVPDTPRLAVVELVHAGRGRFLRDGVHRDVEAGDAILHPPFGDHTIEWLEDDCERTYVIMTTRLFGQRTDRVLHQDGVVQRDAALLPAAVSLIEVLIDEPDALVATVAAQTLHALLAATVAAAIRPHETAEDLVLRERVRDVLLARHTEPDLDADAVARELRISRRHLFAQFSSTHDTFASTLRDIRLEHAAEMLAGGPSLTVRRVARESGFGGATQLARAFRDRFGVSPTEFRAAATRLTMPE